MREFKWSPSEKAIARKAFDQALNDELQQLVREAKPGQRSSRNRPSYGS
jgi:hypothetical protein